MNPAEFFQNFIKNHDILEAQSVINEVEKVKPKDTFDIDKYNKSLINNFKYNKIYDIYKSAAKELFDGNKRDFINGIISTSELGLKEEEQDKFMETVNKLHDAKDFDKAFDLLMDDTLHGNDIAFKYMFSDITKLRAHKTYAQKMADANEKDVVLENLSKLDTVLYDELDYEKQVDHTHHENIENLKNNVSAYSEDKAKQEEMVGILNDADQILTKKTQEGKSYFDGEIQNYFSGGRAHSRYLNRVNSSQKNTYKEGKYSNYLDSGATLDDLNKTTEHNLSEEISKESVVADEKYHDQIIEIMNDFDAIYGLKHKDVKSQAMDEGFKEFGFRKLVSAKKDVAKAIEEGDFGKIEKAVSDYKTLDNKISSIMNKVENVFKDSPVYKNNVNVDSIRSQEVPWKYVKNTSLHTKFNCIFQLYVQAKALNVSNEEYVKNPIKCINEAYKTERKENGIEALINNENLLDNNAGANITVKFDAHNTVNSRFIEKSGRGLKQYNMFGPVDKKFEENSLKSEAFNKVSARRQWKEQEKAKAVTAVLSEPFKDNNKSSYIAIFGANLLGKASEIKLNLGKNECDLYGASYTKDQTALANYKGELDYNRLNEKINAAEAKLNSSIKSKDKTNIESIFGVQAGLLEIMKNRELTPQDKQLINKVNGFISRMPDKTVKQHMKGALTSFNEHRRLMEELKKDEPINKDNVTFANISELPDILNANTSSWRTGWKSSPEYENIIKALDELKKVNDRMKKLNKLDEFKQKDPDILKEMTEKTLNVQKACRKYLKKKDNDLLKSGSKRSDYEFKRVLDVSRLERRFTNELANTSARQLNYRSEIYENKLKDTPIITDKEAISKKVQQAAYKYVGNYSKANNYKPSSEDIKAKLTSIMNDRAFQRYVCFTEGKDIVKAIDNGTIEKKLNKIRRENKINDNPDYLNNDNMYFKELTKDVNKNKQKEPTIKNNKVNEQKVQIGL